MWRPPSNTPPDDHDMKKGVCKPEAFVAQKLRKDRVEISEKKLNNEEKERISAAKWVENVVAKTPRAMRILSFQCHQSLHNLRCNGQFTFINISLYYFLFIITTYYYHVLPFIIYI